MKLFVSKSAVLSLALLVSPMIAMEAPTPAPVVEKIAEAAAEVKGAVKGFAVGEKVGEVVGKIKASMPSIPARPTGQEVKASLVHAKDTVVAYAKEHPYKTTAIIAATAAVVYAVYKVCTAKKAKAKVVVVKAN